jgi:hypothetical protein
MMTNAMFVVVFWFSYETKIEDNDERALSLFSTFFSCITEDNDEPLDSLSSSITQEKNKKNIENKKRTMSLPFLQPKKKTLMLVSLGLLEMTTSIPTCHHLLAFLPHLQKMTTPTSSSFFSFFL